MSADQNSPLSPDDDFDDDELDEEGSPSIFRSTWVRVVLVVLGVALVSAVAVPYVLDTVHPPSPPSIVATGTPDAAPPLPASAPAPAPMPAARADEKTARSGEKTREPASAVTDMKPPASSVPGTRVEAPKVARPAPSDVRTDANKRPTSRSPIPSGRAADAADAIRGGEYFVQVGAFKDREAARRLVSTLRAQNYRVDESVLHGDGVPAPAGPRAATAARSDRYELIVSGASSADINTKLAAKGLVSEAAGDNVRIRPTLSLRDAVALSKDLNTEGLKVQMRRGNGAPADALARAAAPAPGAREARYRVRVGGYPDRASALLAVRELERKGYTPFIARGRDEGR